MKKPERCASTRLALSAAGSASALIATEFDRKRNLPSAMVAALCVLGSIKENLVLPPQGVVQ
ncbi:MAG: hypothetical protein H9864_01680 [Candidatus Faecalibacterium intestinavium]|uniref:Uncharacterized protein n=1 Tax=Candidatus Faecalibacterium intestinavium TaxID=2838580 RepID=A0A9E2NPU5_9FIRM|nr:hypothetical protein [Candidatus Faecalibacterium intestinavium]